MDAIARLKRDHAVLRAKLDMLEGGLRMGPEAWFVLREVSHTLARQLRDHIRREEALVAACRQGLTTDTVERLAVEHREEPERLRVLNRLFIANRGRGLEELGPALKEVISALRRHMEEEEAEFFPVLERTLAGRTLEAPPRVAVSSSGLDEVRTVNWTIQQFPRTRSVFEQLFINVTYEGSDCLDEVAWRHGMESRELLERLERVADIALTPEDAQMRGSVSYGCTRG